MEFVISKKQNIVSTQSDLMALSRNYYLEEGFVLIADSQSAGRGQGSNKWESEPGKNLTFSLLLRPSFLPVAHQFDLMQALSLAVVDFVSLYVKDGVSVKWPNDIYIGKKKICGCLIQNRILGCSLDEVYCGIGININQEVFSFAPNPTSLFLETAREYDLDDLLVRLLACIAKRYEDLQSGLIDKMKQEYLSKLLYKGVFAEYIYNEKRIQGCIVGINEYGYLILECKNGERIEAELKELVFTHKEI